MHTHYRAHICRFRKEKGQEIVQEVYMAKYDADSQLHM